MRFSLRFPLSLVVLLGGSACGGAISSLEDPDSDVVDGASETASDGSTEAATTDSALADEGPIFDGGSEDVPTIPDGVTSVDATPPPPSGVACGKEFCDPAVQVCCAGGSTSTCVAKGKCPVGSAELACSSSASCTGGKVCCFGSGRSACEDKCSGFSAQMCASDAECKPGERCQPALGGYKTCRRAAPGTDAGVPDFGPIPDFGGVPDIGSFDTKF